jgi:hypothetical protein
MSEPYLIEPASLPTGSGGSAERFVAGPDLYPLELAHYLGKDVTSALTPVPDVLGDMPFQDIYGVSWKTRYDQMLRTGADRWIDFTDTNGDRFPNYEPKLGGLALRNDFPATYEDYLKIIDYQWAFGKVRAKEALAQKKAKREHVREPSPPDYYPYAFHTIPDSVSGLYRVVSAPVAAGATFVNEVVDEKKDWDQALLATLSQQGLALVAYVMLNQANDWYKANSQRIALGEFRHRVNAACCDPRRMCCGCESLPSTS